MTTALVTGSSTGIGFATAVRLAADGLDVVATMRDPAAAGDAVLAAAEGLAGSVRLLALDVTDDASVAAAFAEAGPIDVLVSNAGYSDVAAVEELDLGRWKAMFETNVFGAVRCIQAVLPQMRERGDGCIVVVSSLAGRNVLPFMGPYASSKFALEALAEAVAIEGRPFGVRVGIVEPGATATAISGKTEQPSRSSSYWALARNWGASMAHAFGQASDPAEIAARIAEVVADPGARLRHPLGSGAEAEMRLRARLDDEAWVDLWSSPTRAFIDGYLEHTGVDLDHKRSPQG